MSDTNVKIGLEVAVHGSPKAADDLSAVDRAVRGVGESAQAASTATGRFYDSMGRLREANGRFVAESDKTRRGTDGVADSLGKAGEAAGKTGGAFEASGKKGSGAFGTVTKAGNALYEQLGSIAVKLAAIISAYKAFEAASSFLRKGFAFNAEWEQSRIGIASVLASVNKLRDEQGRLLTGVEAYNGAMELAGQAMERIKIMGLETTATTGELVAGFQSLVGPAAAVGMNMNQTMDFTLSMVQALGALGIPLNQLSAEARSLLDGTIVPTQDRLAVALGITGDMVKNWKQQGKLVEELSSRLEMFKFAGDDVANTWAGLTSNMQDALAWLSGTTGTGFFTGVKQSYKELMAVLVDVRNARAGDAVDNIAASFGRLQTAMGDGVVTVTRKFIAYLRELNEPEHLAVLEKRLGELWRAADTAMGALSTAGGYFVDFFGKAIDGWMRLPDTVRDMGLIAAVVYGKKGMVALTGISALFDSVTQSMAGFQAVAEGRITFGDLATANSAELKQLLADANSLNGLLQQEADLEVQIGNLRKQLSPFEGVDPEDNATTIFIHNLQTEMEELERRATETARAINALGAPVGSYETGGFAGKIKPRVEATGDTGVDTGKARAMEAALKSLRMEMARLQLSDAEFKRFQLMEKIEGLEKTLGRANPEVAKFRALAEQEMQNNLFQAALEFADPAEAATVKLAKSWQDFSKNVEALYSRNPEEKQALLTAGMERYRKELEKVNPALEKFKDFIAETDKLEKKSSLSRAEYRAYELNQQAVVWRKELDGVKDQEAVRLEIERRMNAELLKENEDYAADLGKLWEESYKRVDDAVVDMLMNIGNSSKDVFSGIVNTFKRMLAEMANAALLRPITLSIMGSLGGLFGASGLGNAGVSIVNGQAVAGGTGGSGGVGGLGNLLGNVPISNFLPDSLTGGMSGLLGTTLPGTSLTATLPSGVAGPVGTYGGLALGSAFMAGGLGSLGYGTIGSMIGLPQNKYTGITSGVGGALGAWGGSALGASMAAGGAAAGATVGSVFPVVGTIIGALAGGLLGSLFGGKKSSPSVWIDDTVGPGVLTDDWKYKFENFSESDRVDDSAKRELWGQIGDFANQTVAGFKTFANALPAQYSSEVTRALQNTRVDFGYYDIQTKKWEEHAQQAMEGIQKTLFDAFGAAMGDLNLSGKLGLNMDLSNQAGIEKAVQAVTVWKEMQTALDELLNPVAAITQQTTAANVQMTAWIDSMRALGWQEHKLAEMEARRAEYVSAVTFQLRNQFDMEMTLREAQLRGTGEIVSAQQAMWQDWQSIVANFGAGSEQARRWQAYQKEALPKLAEELAKSRYQSQIDALKSEASQQVQALKAVTEQLASLRSGLLLDARVSPFDTDRRSEEAGAGFASAYAKAMAGDTEAAKTLSSSTAGYLELLKARSASSAEYEALFYGVMGQLGEVEKLFGVKADGVDSGILEQQKGNKTLAEILEEIKKLEQDMAGAVSGNAGALQDYLAGLLNGSIRTRATGGYTPPGLTLVGEEGPELVNFTRPGMVYTAEQTRAALFGGGGPYRAATATSGQDVTALRQEIYQLRRDLLMALDRLEQHSRRAAETVEGWDVDGLPAARSAS